MKEGVTVDVQLASGLAGIPTPRTFRRWLLAALSQPASLTIRVVNAKEGRELNRIFRSKDYATNVLTFSYHEPKAKNLTGDIVLCAPVVHREAREQQKTHDAHYAHMTVHGALHLAGMDHETSRDAKKMEAREVAILAMLGFENPYA